MEKLHLEVTGSNQGLRLDQYIIKNLSPAAARKGGAKFPLSRSRIQSLINSGKITVNQKPAKAHYKVKENDAVLIDIPPAVPPQVLPEEIPLEIVFEDDDFLVIDKPTGMVTHPAVGVYSHTLVNALLNYGCPLSTINGPLRPGIVHRLDKDTSGLLVVAKNDLAHQDLAAQFRRHTVKRRYMAIVKGQLAHNQGVIDFPIARHPQDRRKMTVSFLKSRNALTRYRVVSRCKEITLLELAPQTGRTHQLRVHLKFCGHPILGDSRYGRMGDFERLALHAIGLGFRHPRTEKWVEFTSDLPECFKAKLRRSSCPDF